MTTPSESQSGWTPLQVVAAAFVWLWVAVPFAWGLFELIVKIPALFG